MRNTILITIACLGLSGCLAKQLRPHAQDHYVQAKTIAEACSKAQVLGEGVCTQEMLDEMAKQAECIHAITEGEKCEGDK